MEEIYTNDRNEFWKLLKSMKGKIVNDELARINDLIDHFNTLFSKEGKIDDSENDEIKSDRETTHRLGHHLWDKLEKYI